MTTNNKKYKKYSNKKTNAAKEGIPFLLSFKEYCILMKKAGISENDIGIKKFHLARYKDSGPYSINNCRFIYYIENLKEKKNSEKNKLASRNNILKVIQSRTPEERKRIAKLAGAASAKSENSILGKNKLSSQEINKRIKKIKNSKINLHIYGWVTKVSLLLGITHTQVRRFMEAHYTGSYFKRK